MPKPVRFKPDKVLRDRFFTPESYAHPAKGHLGLWWEILERYTNVGECVLDPMAGVGATMLGALMGRNIICVEKESQFITPMQASWAKMRQNPMLGQELGEVVILQGDARCLPLGRIDCVVTSPPYEQEHQGGPDTKPEAQQGGMSGRTAQRYTDVIITSPPYEGSLDAHQDGIDWEQVQRPSGGYGQGKSPQGYTRPVDAVVTSPPYEQAQTGGGIAQEGYTKDYQPDKISGGNLDPIGKRSYMSANIGSAENIGNLKGQKYWDAVTQVYSECHRCLKPAGLLVLVLKGLTRDGKYVDLPAETQVLCESLGFNFVETWQRELWNLGFWRILQKRNSPEGWDERLWFETVLALRRNNA